MVSATEGMERVGCSGAEVVVGAASATAVWAPESDDAESREMLSILGASAGEGGASCCFGDGAASAPELASSR